MEKILTLIIIVLLVWFNVSEMNAQKENIPTITVSAQIVDEWERPLEGIVVYNSISTVITDKEGRFSIEVPSTYSDKLIIEEDGFKTLTIEIRDENIPEIITLKKNRIIDSEQIVELPYQPLESYRSISAINVIEGHDLESYPSTSVLESLSGRIPGLVIQQYNTQPGFEQIGVTIRGVPAAIYIDGILRDASDLSVYEVEKVEVIKDLSGRSALGISAANPVLFITTKKGRIQKTVVNASFDLGYSSPTILPKYVDAYNYCLLYNEARQNDGLLPFYSDDQLEGYRSGSNSLRYPNINYYDDYVKNKTGYRRVNINAKGGNNFVRYYSMLDYNDTGGLEAVGIESTSNRFKLRGNVDLNFTDFLSLSVNLSGTYGKSKYPNEGGGAAPFNMFNSVLSRYPSNAHAVKYEEMLLQSQNYPINIINELKYSGFAEKVNLNTQNSSLLKVDLGTLVKGLGIYGMVSFDVNNSITNNKGGTEALYRHKIVEGEDVFERVVEKNVETAMTAGDDFFLRRTTINLGADYDRKIGLHEFTINGAFYQMLEETKSSDPGYQPRKTQDICLRGNYAYNQKYVLQLDLSYSGNMKLPKGDKFNLFPSFGAGWIASNEDFLADNSVIDYLKFFFSSGTMGVDDFYISGYDQFYLYKTLWRDDGGWQSGIEGNKGEWLTAYRILQEGSQNYSIPKRNYFNIGFQSVLFDKSLSIEANYFYQKNYDKISLLESRIPLLFGTGGFLPAANYGEDELWGIDGFIQYTKKIGDFDLSIGMNAAYARGKYLKVDEPLALEEHRKLENKATDLIWGYETEGLFQSESEIENYQVSTIWGDVKPGDIKYVDYTGDNVVDEKDMHPTGAHWPRFNYGINLSLKYKNWKLKMIGKGVADGKVMLNHSNYFWINRTNQNFSSLMLERWPQTNNYPRLTLSSPHNYQSSTFWLRDASYFSLSNVELSYIVPRKISTNWSLKDIVVFLRGKNLAYFSGLKDYDVNPENLDSGISSYPLLKNVTLGLSVTF